LQGSDGAFYGTTDEGGASGWGTVFKITANGTHTLLHSFNNTSGRWPAAGLVQGSDGDFYGTTYQGGARNNGTVFKITASGTHTLLYSFNSPNGGILVAGLVQGSDGAFYGTTFSGGSGGYGTVFKITPSGTHSVLHSFNGSNGRNPHAGLVRGSDGDFYGTTYEGGASNNGTVYKITANGTHTVLHSFNRTNGRWPTAGLVQGSDGAFYGTTEEGGASDWGTVFKITSSGTHTLLHSFNRTSGNWPRAELVQGSDGDFYGTTYSGGVSEAGTVFKITSSGTYTLLHSFNGSNGIAPWDGLVQGSDGDFYGTTYYGGANDYGTVFKITSSGTHTLLHSFNNANGRHPIAGLVKGRDGAFYGTTEYGATASGYGTVFKITSSGTHTLLHSFDGSQAARPSGIPVFGSDGHLYGTANLMAVWRMNFPSPEIALSGNGVEIVTGDATPEAADHTQFGSAGVAGGMVVRTFTIINSGTVALALTGTPLVNLSGSAAFSVSAQPASATVAAQGGTQTFEVTFQPSTPGPHTAVVSIANNDADEALFAFTVAGAGTEAASIALSGNRVGIANGDSTPRGADHTDFGWANHAFGTVSRNYTIINTGLETLLLTGLPRVEISGEHAADFRVTMQPDSPVAVGESAAFTVTFDPSEAGLRSAMVSIASNAPADPLFTFAIRGAGTGFPDTKKPTLKLAIPAGKTVSAPSPLMVAGTAGDDYAVQRVEVVLNGGEVVLAELGASSKPSAVPFSAQITPAIGENTLVVTAYDPSGNSTSITRVFTFERRYLLTLLREVPAALETMPDKAGTVVLKAATAKNATALTKGNPATSQVLPGTPITVTAAAKTSQLFSHWTGLPEGAEVRGNVAALVMPAEDTGVTAVFVANPLTQGAMAALGAKPVFQGLLRPDETTPPGNDTAGFLSAALTPAKGSLSGKLWMDGLVVPFTGALHGDGSVWFKAGAVLASALPFAGRELSMTWDESGLTMTVTRTVNEVTHVSTGKARPPLYSKAAPVRGALLDAKGKQGYYTLGLPAVAQVPFKPAAEYPQGTGHAGLTLLSTGTLKLAGTLAEGTKVTAASFLVEGDAAEVFVVLPTPGGKTKAGSLLGTLVFDEAHLDSDATSADMRWFRPVAETKPSVLQAYRAGWPGGIALGLVGALYDGSVPVQTALGLGNPVVPTGNAALFFENGKLADELSARFNFEGNKVVKLDARDKTWSLVLTPKTGMMSGAFTPDWPDAAKKLPVFRGVLLQKGANARGCGYFLSNAAGDIEPDSGAVELGSP